MKNFFYSRDAASKGAALMIVLAFVVLLTGVALAYFSRTTTDRQLAQSSYNDTSADLLARSALDVVVGDFKQELLSAGAVTRTNIQPQRSGDDASIPNLIRRSVRNEAIPFPGVPSLASAVSSGPVDPTHPQRGEITSARWNSHYLIPPGVNFAAPDWVLVTAQGPAIAPVPGNVIGRYAFGVYDEGGLLDMNLAGYAGWSGNPGCAAPSPTPWLVNVGRKGIVAFADLTALGPNAPSQGQIDKIVGWRNYATTQRTFTNFPSGAPGFTGETNCTKQDNYGSYLLYFGDPPFSIESVADRLAASTYPFTSVATEFYPPAAPGVTPRTDQTFMTRQQLLKLQSSLGFSQNLLQYMGTFSRERNRPAPDWPNLQNNLSEGRFNLNNLALVKPNPGECNILHGKKKGWQTGKNRNHLCGTPTEIIELFGLFWRPAATVNSDFKHPGYWKYVDHTGPNPPGDPDPNPHSIICWRGANHQADFFQVLHYALNVALTQLPDSCSGIGTQPRTFGIGASLIDQYDSGEDCFTYTPANWSDSGCDLDKYVVTNNGNNLKYSTHTTLIQYGQGGGNNSFAYGMEPDYAQNPQNAHDNGDDPWHNDCSSNQSGNNPHRPCLAPTPGANTQVISHAFSNTGEFGYGIDTSALGGSTPLPTLNFSSPTSTDAPVLDFFSYNPVSSAYPRAGVVNLYTRNAPVLAAILSLALKTDAAASLNPPSPVVSGTPYAGSEAQRAADAIVAETQRVLAGTVVPAPAIPQVDLTRAIAGRLANVGASAVGWASDEQKETIARAIAEMGQTRTWNLFIDVIAQTGRYSPDATDINQANKFNVEGEKRYWLHIALGRDLVHTDGTPCLPGESGCQVDVLGTQLEEVID